MSAVTVRTSSRWTARRLTAVIGYTLRSCFGRRRWLGCLIPCAGAVLFGLLATTRSEPAAEAFARVSSEGIFGLVLPVAALVIGDAVLGADVRSGVLHFTWLSPTPLGLIVLGRWLGGAVIVLVTVVPACILAAFVAGAPESAWAIALAGGATAMAYIGVFVAISTIARRTAVWSIAFVFLVEGLLGNVLTGVAQWSPTWQGLGVFTGYAPGVPNAIVRDGIPEGGAALVRLAVITVVMLLFSRWRLSRMKFTGAAD
jgi:ABC-2 type transport system permease protein